ncbi:MAG: L,D-transpeptidase family protein [Sphingobacteriales bacterium]|nr:L,D-transpeptidase family protein [Sphingobacteriales bacterium]
MLSDGFMHIIKDLKRGRLSHDSVSLNNDSIVTTGFLTEALKNFVETQRLTEALNAVEPKHQGYWELKKGIKSFLDNMDWRVYTPIQYPFKETDSTAFKLLLQKRLYESNCIAFSDTIINKVLLMNAIKKYQKKTGLKQDGIISASLIHQLGTSDLERFKQIAITLDKYKLMPETMPEKYIWVNLPGYYLRLWDHDTVSFESKIVCGKPETRTPLLNSYITDMIIYPTWTVPTSIILKQEYLPKLKSDPNYLSTLNLHLVNRKGETINPDTVDWNKYSKGIPYSIVQSSGDDNALGVMKFNFSNKYAVYLHDTNQRYLFGKTARALSHGCVRVQEWEKLAFYIARNDSMNLKPGEKLSYTVDKIKYWLAQKEKKTIVLKNKMPLFITYLTCEGKDGRIKFYDDIYGEDKVKEKTFLVNN